MGMKIVDVAEFYAERGGGVRTYLNAKLEAGRKLGHEVVVIAPGPEDAEEQLAGGRILWVKSRPMPLDPRYYLLTRERAVHALLDRERPDVVEGSSPWTGGWFVARWRPRSARPLKAFVFHQDPVAVFPHTLLDRWWSPEGIDRACEPFWAYLRRLSAPFDLTVVAGEWLARRLASFGIRNPTAVPFGVDKASFHWGLRDEALREQLLARCNLPATSALLVAVSRHHPEKRLGTLLAALRQLGSERPVGLVLFGDGPLRRWVRLKVRDLPHVHVAGVTHDRAYLARALASADAFLHGSAAETYGLVVGEALCSGTPIIVPDRGGAADLAAPEYAEQYRPGDARSCAAAIRRWLARDHVRLHEAAHRASETRVRTMEEHFPMLFECYADRLQAVRAVRDASAVADAPLS